jgi:AraC-like DNA-binding protein
MDADENDIYTIEAIAEMAGFGTRQSFYNTFEKVTGVKPAYYRTSLRQKQHGEEEVS